MRIFVKIKKVPKLEKKLQKALKQLKGSYELIERYGINYTTANISTEKIKKIF
jgi:hypothetical protein